MTAGGTSKSWTHGLLSHGPINYPDRDQLMPGGQWYTWDSPELLATLPN
jgi:hypothetical protein